MATENDVGTSAAAAAAALFHLHSSPLVTAEYSFAKLNMPSFALPSQSAIPEMREAALHLNGIGRPRSSSWDPTFTSISLLNYLNGEPDASAAGTLCALMKSDPVKTITATPFHGLRPRSQSTSATVPLSHQQLRASKGLRPRSVSVSSNNGTQTGTQTKRATRPRSYSHSSRVSARSATSARNGRKRALSMDSFASGNLDDFDDSDEELESIDSVADGRLDELHKIGRYSPRSRRRRIEKFLEKRRRRIWRKRIKYDVRKNFADSRLRVKGRFVRKEDEEQLREYLQMT